MDWRERVKFILQNDGAIKRLNYADSLKEQNADIPKEDMLVKLDADFILVSEEIKELMEELTQNFGEHPDI